jgi:hypothetical protein
MKIRRAHRPHSLRDVPIDGFDMFLLSLIEEELTLQQMVEISPRPGLETVRHVLRLGGLGLLTVVFESADEQLLAHGWDEAAAQELIDDARTLRPPPMRASGARPSLQDTPEPVTGVRRKPTPVQTQNKKSG